MIDMHADLETVPVDGGKPLYVMPNRRYWPNPVSLEYCARIRQTDGGPDEEHWYDDEGKPLDPSSPAIRNVRVITAADLKTAFLAGAGNGAAMAADRGEPTEQFGDALARFDVWIKEYLG